MTVHWSSCHKLFIHKYEFGIGILMICTMCIPLFHKKWLFHFEPSGVCLVRILLYHQRTCNLVSREEPSSYFTREHGPAARIQLYDRIEIQGVSRHPGRNAYPGQDRITWSGYNPPASIYIHINMHIYVYIHMHIYIHRERESDTSTHVHRAPYTSL